MIIIGAGAAGLMCALTAGHRGRRVLLLDHAAEPGAKILISGGGRCNFTNTGAAPDRFLSDNPHFCRSALERYTPQDFIAMVEQHGIAYHEKTRGQLFCDESARAILDMLLQQCAAAQVELRLGHPITDLSRADRFQVVTDQGRFLATSLVLATGGLSIPKLGATGFAYDVCRRFGLRLTGIRPGLVPLTFADDLLALMRPLSGVSLDTEATLGRHRFHAPTLFTHRGLSGPAILQISSFWRDGPIALNLLPGQDAAQFLRDRKQTRPKAEVRSVLAELLPQRLAHALAAPLDPAARRMADQPDRLLTRLASQLSAWQLTPSGSEGLRQGGSNLRRRRHTRSYVAHDAGECGARPVRHRRGGGCHRLAGRLQLPVGLGERLVRRPGGLATPVSQRFRARTPSLSMIRGRSPQRQGSC